MRSSPRCAFAISETVPSAFVTTSSFALSVLGGKPVILRKRGTRRTSTKLCYGPDAKIVVQDSVDLTGVSVEPLPSVPMLICVYFCGPGTPLLRSEREQPTAQDGRNHKASASAPARMQ